MPGFASTVTVPGMTSAGTILTSGRLLPEKTDPVPVVPEWPQFMRGCIRYRQSLDRQARNAPRTSEPYDDDDA